MAVDDITRHKRAEEKLTVRYRKKTGETFPGETNVYYLRSEDGEVIGFIGMIRDVTERNRMQGEKAKTARSSTRKPLPCDLLSKPSTCPAIPAT